MASVPIYMSRTDYDRIVKSANTGLDTTNQSLAAKRAARKAASDKRVSTWSNTLEASRKKKFEARRLKEEALEKERQRVDEEEERVRAQLRKEAISKAGKLITEQQDLVKRFRSMQGLSDMLTVHDYQIKQKAKQKQQEKEREAYFHQQMLKQLAEAQEKDRKKEEELNRKRDKVARIQKEQLQIQMDRNLRRLVEQKREGEQTVAMAKAAVKAEMEEREERKRIARQNRMEMTAANQEAQRMREEKLAEAREFEERIKAHAAEKEKITEKRKAHLAKKHAQKQAQIQNMIDKAVSHLENMKNTEDARLERAVKQRQQKEEEAHRRKLERRRQEMEAIDASRQHQMARRKELALAEKQADKQMAAEWLSHNRKMIAKEMEKDQKIDQRNRDNARTLQKMAEKRRNEKSSAQRAQKEFYRAKFANEAKEKEKYDKYVQQEIVKYAKAGKNVKALAHALKPQSDLLPAF